MIAIIILVVLVAFIGLFIMNTQRALVSLDEKIENSLSNIGVQQKSRFDALIQLAKAAKGYAGHEADTYVNLAQARSGQPVKSASDAVENEKAYNEIIKGLNVVVEAYPELKADALYGKTMDSINDFENKVRMSRQVYNDCATKYNRTIRQFPTNIVAGMLNFERKDYLEFKDESVNMPDLDL